MNLLCWKVGSVTSHNSSGNTEMHTRGKQKCRLGGELSKTKSVGAQEPLSERADLGQTDKGTRLCRTRGMSHFIAIIEFTHY